MLSLLPSDTLSYPLCCHGIALLHPLARHVIYRSVFYCLRLFHGFPSSLQLPHKNLRVRTLSFASSTSLQMF